MQGQAIGSPEPPLVPNEFTMLRLLLRNYAEQMLALCGGNETDSRTFANVANYVLHENLDFINGFVSIVLLKLKTSISQIVSVDIVAKELLRC